MTGRRIVSAAVTHPRTARFNASREQVRKRVEGRAIMSVGRHGKFLVIGLDDGYTIVAHLGMSGRFAVGSPSSEVEPHTHFRAMLDDGSEIRFIDPRTFGFISAVDEDEMTESGVARLGPDAWANLPSVENLLDALSGRTASIKALLLDQRIVSGLGNIYADEALNLARIHPLTPGGSLDGAQAAALLEAIAEVLDDAIENGGTTLDDLSYLLPDGTAGDNLSSLRVYGRNGEACRVCGETIEKTVVRARSTHFCPNCQAGAW